MRRRPTLNYAQSHLRQPKGANQPFDEAALAAFIMAMLFNPLSVKLILILLMVDQSRFSSVILCVGMSVIPVAFAVIADVRIRAPSARTRGRALIAFALAVVGTSWAILWMVSRIRLE